MGENNPKKVKKKEKPEGTGFAKGTDFRWLSLGVIVFILIAVFMPTPESMITKAESIYAQLSPEQQVETDVLTIAYNIQIIIALLASCVVFFATEAIPMPAVALY